MASPEEDLFGDKEVEDILNEQGNGDGAMSLEDEFMAAEEMEDTLNGNGNGNGNGHGANGPATADGGPQQLPHDQAPPMTPSRQNDNSQAGGVPQPHHNRRLSPFSQWKLSLAGGLQENPHGQGPINPSVQDATSQAGGAQDIPIDPLLDAYSQHWNSQAGGLPQPAQQQGLIDPLTQNPNPEAAPETYSNESNKTIKEFLRQEGFDAQFQPATSAAPEQAPAGGLGQYPAPGGGDYDWQQNMFNDNFNMGVVDGMQNFIEQMNSRPQENFQIGGDPVPGAAEGNGFNVEIQPAASAAPAPEQAPVGGLGQHPAPGGGSQGGEQDIFNQDFNNVELSAMSNLSAVSNSLEGLEEVWLPDNILDYVNPENQQGGPGPGAAGEDGSNAHQIQPAASAAPEQAPAHGGQQNIFNSHDQNFSGGPVTHGHQPNQQVTGSNVAPGGAIQQPHPQNQPFARSQAVPEIVIQQPPAQNQQFTGSQAAPRGVGGYRYPNPANQQQNQFNNGYQQFGGAQTGQGQGDTGGPVNNGGQQFNNGQASQGGGGGGQFNNGGQQFNNAQYGQEEAAIDLLNLGGARAGQVAGGGQFNNQGYQPNNGQNGQGGTGGLNNNGYQQVGGAQTGQRGMGTAFNPETQQLNRNNNVQQDQEGAIDLLNLRNGYQQLGGAQTGHGAGGGQLNRGQQPNNGTGQGQGQGGMAGPFNPQNQQPGHFNGIQTGQAGAGGQFNNGGQQPNRAQTPQGGMGGYLSPGNQRLNQNNGMQNDQGGAGGFLDPGFQQFNSPQPRQGGAGGHLSPVYNNQQAGLPNAAGGANQHPFPGNQPLPGSPYGAGGVAQPGSGIQQFGGSPYGVGGAGSPLHPGPQPQPGFGNVNPQAVQNNNGGIPDPNQPPAVGSAPPEPRPPPVVTPPVFPPGTPQPDSWVAPGSGNEVVKIRAIKVRNQYGIHPHSVYYYRAQTQPWGTEYDEAGRPGRNLFVYANSQPLARAELVASKLYTASQLSLFFRGEGHPNRPNRHLTLWIQNLPLLVADRYAQKETGKCRYKECAAKPNYTILKGFHRVAFDEHSHHTGDYYDPYNNAGYMHLWCFEKAFDAGYLVWDVQERPHLYGFRIEADVRHHRFEERNNASLNRDHNLHDTYRQWKNEQWERYVQLRHQEATTGQRYDPYQTVDGISNDNRLWRRLTDKHIAEEVPARARNRTNRNVTGNTIDNHRGDLAQFIRVKTQGAGAGAGGSQNGTPGPGSGSGPSTPSPNKRKRNGAASGEEEEEGSTPGSSGKKARTANANTSMGPPPPPSTPRRSTRRSSLALANNLNEQLGSAGESPLTRSRATFLGQQLNQLPEHLQQDVISHAPQALSPLLLQNWRPENWGAVLQERVSRMTPYHQGLLAAYAEKTEKKAQLDGGTGKRRWRSDP